jgi:hypothetical protein
VSLANAIKTLVGGSDELLEAAVRKANFDRWFGRSKVVDHQGQPRVQYHGTPGDFDTFNQGELGFHFGTKNAANEILYKVLDGEDANIMPVHLAIQNPVQLPDMMQWDVPQAWDQHWLGQGTGYQGEYLRDLRARNKIFEVVQRHGGAYNDSPSDQFAQDMRAALQALGYDGVKYHNRVEDPGKISWIAFDPTQIKSAIGNRGTFDPTDPNILRAAAPVAAGGLGAAALAAPEESEAGIGLDRLASMARPVNEVRQALGKPVLGEHVYPMAELILDMQQKAAVGLAGLASPGDTRAAKLNRDMARQPVQVPAVAATVSDLMRDMLLDPAGYLGPLEPTTLGNGEQLPPGELARLLSGGGGGY